MTTEAEFQQQVIDLAHAYGWMCLHVRRTIGKGRKWTTATSVVGWPDLFLWHPKQQRRIGAELKSETGKATVEQLEVLATLAASGVETFLWRPSDLDTINGLLSPRGAALLTGEGT